MHDEDRGLCCKAWGYLHHRLGHGGKLNLWHLEKSMLLPFAPYSHKREVILFILKHKGNQHYYNAK